MISKVRHKKAESIIEAWRIAQSLFPTDYIKDESSSKTAGYSVYRSTVDYYSYICDLGCRIEVNLSDGTTINIWIEDMTDKVRQNLAQNTRALYPM